MTVGRGKSKKTACWLALSLGFLGAHHFYLGSAAAGLFLLLMTLLGGVGLVIAYVEGVTLAWMSVAEFDAKYNFRRPELLEFAFQQRP